MDFGTVRNAGLWACLLAHAPLPAETVLLRYAPADGAQYLLTETTVRQTVAGDRHPVTDRHEQVSHVRVARSDTGFANRVTIRSLTLARNGAAVASPVFAAMADLELVYALDIVGNLLRITGYERLPEAMARTLPEAMAQTLTPMLNTQSLAHEAKQAYGRVFGEIAGASYAIGVARGTAKMQALPYGGSTPVYVVDLLERRTERDGLLQLTRQCNSDPAELADQFATVSEADLIAAAEAMRPAMPAGYVGATVKGTVKTLLDPNGLLVSKQESRLEYELVLTQPSDQPVTFRIQETQSFTAQPVPAAGDSRATQ